jgi:hypothetical protein
MDGGTSNKGRFSGDVDFPERKKNPVVAGLPKQGLSPGAYPTAGPAAATHQADFGIEI